MATEELQQPALAEGSIAELAEGVRGEVIRAVEFARSEKLVVAVRGGKHSIPGFSTVDGGIVIDLSPMKGIQVDPDARTVRAQGGVTWSAPDHETQAFGLAVT